MRLNVPDLSHKPRREERRVVALNELERLIEDHHRRRPLTRARDYYKLLYQGVFSVGHMMGEDAFPRLKEEAERVKELGPWDDPMVESVSLKGDILRVNLRPFIKSGGSLEALYLAMVASAEVKGDPMQFLRLWRLFKQMADRLSIVLDENEVCEIDDALGERGPVPMHHTAQYREAYYPAYRVVKLVDLESAGLFL
jgi:hypothetical protein